MTTPVKKIKTNEDLSIWQESESYNELCKFVENLAESVKGKDNDAKVEVRPGIEKMLMVLDAVEAAVDKFPVKDKESSRFGKPEFRDFYDYVSKMGVFLLSQLEEKEENDVDSEEKEGELSSKNLEEISHYFKECWGNRTRIDYGSGHELNFICVLLCLYKLEYFHDDDFPALVLKVFFKYVQVMRRLQKVYWLEPAGSHGVWGLDDYHFLPFLFGAWQLATHSHLKPKSIHNKEYVDMFKDKYMYFHCIWFVNSVKTASLRWHSPMLDDISGVKSWAKVAEGMIKMYKAEVLGKLPIMQHFMFGSIIKAPEGVSELVSGGNEDTECEGHNHSWGDCCGIRLPSAIAAHEMTNVKDIPFD